MTRRRRSVTIWISRQSRSNKMEKLTFDIPYIKLRFYMEFLEDSVLPEEKVSALRGGMGNMSLGQYCVGNGNCDACMFVRTCPVSHTLYTYMEKSPGYVTGKQSVGYLIECNDRSRFFGKGSRMAFYLILFGDSIGYFNLYLDAFRQMGKYGIGKNHSMFRIVEVRNIQGRKILSDNRSDMDGFCVDTLDNYVRMRKDELMSVNGKYLFTFQTPLAMKFQKEYMNEFYAEALVKGAARRIQILNYYTGHEADMPGFSQYPVIMKQTVKQERIKRYSETQKSRISLRGISGQIIMEKMPEECLEFLIAGELTHIGKNTSFGFGKYFIDIASDE